MPTVFKILAALLPIAALINTAVCEALPGQLDASWGSNGKVGTAVGTNHDRARAIALQPDGKVLVGGECFVAPAFDFCITRYLQDGRLDDSWGNNGRVITSVGVVTTDPSLGNDTIYALAVQPDGKILAGGNCGNTRINDTSTDFCVVRYLPDGSLDPAWNGNGKVLTRIRGSNRANTMVLQPDGKVLLGGYCEGFFYDDICIVRYLPNGAPDPSWSNTAGAQIGPGIVLVFFNENNLRYDLRIYTMAVLPDGDVLVGGECFVEVSGVNNVEFCTARFFGNGTANSTWGVNGFIVTPVSGTSTSSDRGRAMVVQPDGKVVLAGQCAITGFEFCVVRYNPGGAIDASFAYIGKTSVNVGPGDDFAHAVALQPDGKILIAGDCAAANGFFDSCITRFNPDGASLDVSWNGSGKTITPVSTATTPSDTGRAIALQPDGKVLVAGWTFNGAEDDFLVVRYDGGPQSASSCSMDIDGDGVVLATTDTLILTRMSLGLTGSAVIGGISFASHASRKTWSAIREFMVYQCGTAVAP
jgi:uncharacterized delta-60 repeat protein